MDANFREDGCDRDSALDAAYELLKSDMGPQRYAELLQAIEDTLREEGSVFVPGAANSVEGMLTGGQFRWCVLNSEHGQLLAIYTSNAQLQKRAEVEVGVALKITACFDFIAHNDSCAGFVINPQDDLGGVVVKRNIVEQIRSNAAVPKGCPVISLDLVSESIFALWGNAINVPVMVMTVNEEAELVGGMERIVNPIVERWESEIRDDATKEWTPERFVERVMESAYDDSVAAGVMVHVDKSVFATMSPDEWVRYQCEEEMEDDIEDVLIRRLGIKQGQYSDYRVWEEARRENVKKYLEILEAKVGLAFRCENRSQVYEIFVANIGMVVVGIVMFGLGYGAAMYAESRGPEEVERIKNLQCRYLEEGYESARKPS